MSNSCISHGCVAIERDIELQCSIALKQQRFEQTTPFLREVRYASVYFIPSRGSLHDLSESYLESLTAPSCLLLAVLTVRASGRDGKYED